jgi:hypothetical protein
VRLRLRPLINPWGKTVVIYRSWCALVVVLGAVSLASCGGGSSPTAGGPSSNGGGPGPEISIAGVAATGAPLSGAAVFLKDKTGAEPVGQDEANGVAAVTTDGDGNYEFTQAQLAGLTPPFVLKVRGTTVLDNGDDAAAVFHAVVNPSGVAQVNLTQLTEAAAMLSLGADPKEVFQSPTQVLPAYSDAAGAAANATLIAALGIDSQSALAGMDVVSAPLDVTVNADVNAANPAKLHDLLLDTLAISTSKGALILTDRNRAEEDYATGAQIALVPGASAPEVTGQMSGVQGGVDAARLTALIARLNTQLAAGCEVPLDAAYTNQCDNVFDSSNGIYASDYKHGGMPAASWVKTAVTTPLDQSDMSDVTVTLVTPYRGSYVLPNGVTVTRVLLKWTASGTGENVSRSVLVKDDGQQVLIYGDQKDYFVWIKPQLTYSPDADGTYPHYPKYEVAMNFIVKNWYAGQKDMIIGAHIDGPGLPKARMAAGLNTYGDAVNPNGVPSGVEVFDNTDNGCSNMSIEPTVYVEKNTSNWTTAWAAWSSSQTPITTIRWRPGSTTCAPRFDFLRYKSADDSQFKLPQRGDVYTVTLYLDKSKFDAAGAPPLPAGASSDSVYSPISRQQENVYKLQVSATLMADSFKPPTAAIDPLQFPGVTDATRSSLVTQGRGDAKVLEWTRNRIRWVEYDNNGAQVITPFVNFLAGGFQKGYDAYRGLDTYRSIGRDPEVNNAVSYRDATLFGDANFSTCGKTTPAAWRGGDITVLATNKVTELLTSCADITSDKKDNYWYINARLRSQYQADRYVQVGATKKAVTLTWDQMMRKESVGSMNLCSAFTGFWQYRSAYVNMIDMNGRTIQERREVWGDFPNETAYTGFNRLTEVSRPNLMTDHTYLPHDVDASEYQITTYMGEKGVVNPVWVKNASNQCEPKSW